MDATTTATIIEIDENLNRSGLYGWDYDFSYTVNGQHYVGKSRERAYSNIYATYAVGETVHIVYNPKYPYVSEMIGTTNKTYFLPVSIGLALLFILLLIFSVWRGMVYARTLRYGVFTMGNIGRHKSDYRVSHKIGRNFYYRDYIIGFKLTEKANTEIIYNPKAPHSLYVLERLPVKFDEQANKWRPSVIFFMIQIAVIAYILLLTFVLIWI